MHGYMRGIVRSGIPAVCTVGASPSRLAGASRKNSGARTTQNGCADTQPLHTTPQHPNSPSSRLKCSLGQPHLDQLPAFKLWNFWQVAVAGTSRPTENMRVSPSLECTDTATDTKPARLETPVVRASVLGAQPYGIPSGPLSPVARSPWQRVK